jgi:hypothetical protein
MPQGRLAHDQCFTDIYSDLLSLYTEGSKARYRLRCLGWISMISLCGSRGPLSYLQRGRLWSALTNVPSGGVHKQYLHLYLPPMNP